MAILSWTWLGVAGLVLATERQAVAVDPYLSRLSSRQLWLRAARSQSELVARAIPRCDQVLVTHAHVDHVLDVPGLARRTGALVYGSANVGRVLAAGGVPVRQFQQLAVGELLELGDFAVEVLAAVHGTVLSRPVLPGTTPERKAPLRADDYRLDEYYGFLINVANLRLLDWPSERAGPAPEADVLFVKPGKGDAFYAALLGDVRPRLVVPIHWDDFTRPLSQPPRPMLLPPALAWPPLRRVDLAAFKRQIGALKPSARVFTPQMLYAYDLPGLLTATEQAV